MKALGVLLCARILFRFTTILLVGAVVGGMWVWADPANVYGWGLLAGSVLLQVRWQMRKTHPYWDQARAFVTPRADSARTASRWGERARLQEGMASRSEVRRRGGRAAVRKLATKVRPSLSAVPWWSRPATVRTTDVAVRLCRVGRRWVWASVEDVILIFGGPRAGKTGNLSSIVVDYPGPVVTTSSRPDVLGATRRFRERRGPVSVFNAAGVTNLDDVEVSFDPLLGCDRPDVAMARAADMIPAETGDAGRWAALARQAFSSFLHAAALGGHTMDTVQTWVADPDQHKTTVLQLLRRSSAKAAYAACEQFVKTNDRTRSSITSSMSPALQWLQSDAARTAGGLGTAGRPVPPPVVDLDRLLDESGTVYVLGRSDDDEHVTPLMAAFTGHIARTARRRAVNSPGGRLDPPLGLLLDEAAKLRPPLPDWSTDMGGSGITIVACFQSRAQLAQAWGKEGAAIIINNAAAKLLGGGTADPDDLHAWTQLTSVRDETVHTRDRAGKTTSSSSRSVPVLSTAQLSHLPPQTVVCFRRGMPPAIGRVRMVWDRWDLWLGLHPLPLPRWFSTPRAVSTTSTPVVPPPRVEGDGVVDYVPVSPLREEVDVDVPR